MNCHHDTLLKGSLEISFFLHPAYVRDRDHMPGAESRFCNGTAGTWAPRKRAALVLSISECRRQKVWRKGQWKPSSLFLSRPKYPDSQLTLTCVCFMVEKWDYLYSKKEKYCITQCCNWQGELEVLQKLVKLNTNFDQKWDLEPWKGLMNLC